MPFELELKKVADFGASEPWVARTEMTMLDFFPFLKVDGGDDPVTAFEIKKEAATGLAMSMAEELGQAFIDLRRLRESKGFLSTELETTKAYRDLYGHLWVAYKSRFQELMKLLGYDIGYVFDKDVNFDQLVAAFQIAHPEVDPQMTERIKEDKRTWQKALYTYRNDGEHNIKEPTFDGHPMHSLQNAEVIFSNIWHAIEDVFIHCMQEEFGKQLTIFEIPKENRDQAMPKKYRVGVTLNKVTGEVEARV